MSVRKLIIDGITIPTWASLTIKQSYESIQGVSRDRTADGTLRQREIWAGKIRTIITGGGNAPSGIQEIDTSGSYTIHCIKPLSINSASNVINIPASRRSDAGSHPFGFAIIGDEMIETAVSMAVNEATLTAVAGADGYQVRWFPVITVMSDPVQEDLARGSGFGWMIEAEEV